MILFNQLFKITGQFIFVITIIFFSTLQAKNLDKFNKANNIANYFSGILLLNESRYGESYEYLRKLDGLEQSHESYSSKYLYSLVNSGKFNQAFKYAKKLEKEDQDSFESDLIIGIYHIKNSNLDLSKKFFSRAKKRKSRSILDIYVVLPPSTLQSSSLYFHRANLIHLFYSLNSNCRLHTPLNIYPSYSKCKCSCSPVL